MDHPDAQRFWSKVGFGDGCWLWMAQRDRDGYGRFFFEGASQQLAHRCAWILCNGAIADDLVVRHSCDNPSCVRPEHLLLGSTIDNQSDKTARGRSRNGYQNGTRQRMPEITRSVIAMRDLPAYAVANTLGIHIKTVRKIRRKESR